MIFKFMNNDLICVYLRNLPAVWQAGLRPI